MNNVRQERQQIKPAKGVGDFLWDIYTVWFVGGFLAVLTVFSARGAELLGMPTWAWYFAPIASAGSAVFYWFAHKLGNTRGVRSVSILCGMVLLAVLPLCFLTGFFDGVEQASGDDVNPFGRVRLVLGPLFAWLSLVVMPGIAFIVNGCIVLLLRKTLATSN